MIKEWEGRCRALAQIEELEDALDPELAAALHVSLEHKTQINYDKVYKAYQRATPEVQTLMEELGLVIVC